MSSKLLYCSVFYLLVLVVRRSHSQLIHECADDQAEFTAGNWVIPPGTLYADSTDDLPSIFQRLGFEIGIYYIEGMAASQDFMKDSSFILPERPIYLYIKYYIHILNDIGQFVYVLPGFGPDVPFVKLPVTYDFQWQEMYLEIDSNELPIYGLMMVSEINLQHGEYLLIEKLIIAQGEPISSIDEIRDLCPSKVPITTTTDTLPQTSTVSSTFICERPGHFPDPWNCSIYHVCYYDEFGDLSDMTLSCSHFFWCPETEKCENPQNCPCKVCRTK